MQIRETQHSFENGFHLNWLLFYSANIMFLNCKCIKTWGLPKSAQKMTLLQEFSISVPFWAAVPMGKERERERKRERKRERERERERKRRDNEELCNHQGYCTIKSCNHRGMKSPTKGERKRERKREGGRIYFHE